MKEQIIKNQQGAAGLVLMLALVVVLFCVVLVRAYVSNHNELKQKKIEQTIATLTEAQNALIGFATRYGRLPCPTRAPLTPTDPPPNGLEAAPIEAGCSNGQFGILPWATLGVKGTDAWGNRFTYRASWIYSRQIPPLNTEEPVCKYKPNYSSIASCSRGDMQIRRGVIVEPAVPAVIISHGPNGIGAYRKDGQKDTSSSPDSNERTNYTDGNIFFASQTSPVIFDDIVFWVDNNSLIMTMKCAYRFQFQNPQDPPPLSCFNK